MSTTNFSSSVCLLDRRLRWSRDSTGSRRYEPKLFASLARSDPEFIFLQRFRNPTNDPTAWQHLNIPGYAVSTHCINNNHCTGIFYKQDHWNSHQSMTAKYASGKLSVEVFAVTITSAKDGFTNSTKDDKNGLVKSVGNELIRTTGCESPDATNVVLINLHVCNKHYKLSTRISKNLILRLFEDYGQKPTVIVSDRPLFADRSRKRHRSIIYIGFRTPISQGCSNNNKNSFMDIANNQVWTA